MNTKKFIDYEVSLLLAKYGKRALLAALARKLNLEEGELERTLNEIPSARQSRRSGGRASPPALIESLVSKHPEKGDQLKALLARFENRDFLPELRDVRRFFEDHSRDVGRPRSRQQAFPKLLSLLAELDLMELNSILEGATRSSYSALGVISDEVMRTDRK